MKSLSKWLGVAALVVAADQLSKWFVAQTLRLGEEVVVLPFFSWVRWHNPGAAFSMLSDAGGWQRWFFVVLAVSFVGFIIYELRRLPERQQALGWVYALIIGGAVGNLIDRVLHGYVVDFVLVHWQQHYFPAFNVADSALSIGAALWIWLLLSEYLRGRRQQAAS
ncbi:MAG: signal peptidase II [Pseudomonadales bacterium]